MPRGPDHEVLALLARGDYRGFDLAYERHAERIFGFLLRLAGSRAVAEDLFQHTFLRLAEVGPRLRVDSNLRAWLFTVARNAFHSHARAQSIAARAEPELQLLSRADAVDPESGLALDELERALGSLGERDRELLLLLGVEGLSPAEVAAVLDLDRATLRKRVSRARARLAEALDDRATVVAKSG